MAEMSSNKKVLTVSIAAYNVEKYLDQTLESCLPAIKDLDVIVVNDGSKDGTLAIANAWAQRYPDSIRVVDKPNGGYGSTINVAIPLARGKYFRYLDGDDWFDSGLLPEYVALLARYSADAVITPYRRVFENGDEPKVVDCVDYMDDGDHGIDELEPSRAVAAASVTYRTELLSDSLFTMTEGCFYTDIEYAYLPMCHVNTLYVSSVPIYQYRIGREGQSVSIEGIRKHYADIVRVCKRLLRELSSAEGPAAPYLEGCLLKECCTTYRFLCISGPNSKVKDALRDFDSMIKLVSPSIYVQMEKRSKLVLLLRRSGFFGWRFACRYCQRRA